MSTAIALNKPAGVSAHISNLEQEKDSRGQVGGVAARVLKESKTTGGSRRSKVSHFPKNRQMGGISCKVNNCASKRLGGLRAKVENRHDKSIRKNNIDSRPSPDSSFEEVSDTDSEGDELVIERVSAPSKTLYLTTSTGYRHKIVLGEEEQKRMDVLHQKAKEFFNLDPQYTGTVESVSINFHLSLATLTLNDGTKKNVILNETVLLENYRDSNQPPLDQKKQDYIDRIKDLTTDINQCKTDLLLAGFLITNSFAINGKIPPRGGSKGESPLHTIPEAIQNQSFEQTNNLILTSLRTQTDLSTLSTQSSLRKRLSSENRYETFIHHHIEGISDANKKKEAAQALYEISIFYPTIKTKLRRKLEEGNGPIPVAPLDPAMRKKLESYRDQMDDKVDRYALYLATIAHTVASNDLSAEGIKARYEYIAKTIYDHLLPEDKETPKPTFDAFKASGNFQHRELLNYAFDIVSLSTSSSEYLAACAELHFSPKQEHMNGTLLKAYTDCKGALPNNVPNPGQDPWLTITQDAFEVAISKKEVETFEGMATEEKLRNAFIAIAEERADPSTGTLSALKNRWSK